MKPSGPKVLLHLEGLVVVVAACIFYQELGASWITFAALFLAPDLSMLGYLVGKKVGAQLYDVAHTYSTPFLLWLVDYFAHMPAMFPLCLIWVAHIGFDRLLGFGLKYGTGF